MSISKVWFVSLLLFGICIDICFSQTNQLPPSTINNASNILQQLLDQANNLESTNGGGMGTGTGTGNGLADILGGLANNPITNNPIVEFFRNFIMFFLNMFNTLIKLFSGGQSLNGWMSSLSKNAESLKQRDHQAETHTPAFYTNDDDLKDLHAKAHGPDCKCGSFSRANIPIFGSVNEDENKISKRSVSDQVLSAEQVVDFLDAKVVQRLLEGFARSAQN